jgi:hypothetical protein
MRYLAESLAPVPASSGGKKPLTRKYCRRNRPLSGAIASTSAADADGGADTDRENRRSVLGAMDTSVCRRISAYL